MSIIHDLQNDLASEKPISPIILRLRLLAAKLGSEPLEEWIRHESEGYPNNVELPAYRIHGMSFIGNFSGAFGSGISNAPIPPYLIKEIAGAGWEHYKVRSSAAAVDSIVAGGDGVTLDLSNLALLIQGKVYEDMACNQLKGFVAHSTFVEISNAIRNRLLELTISLEKRIPSGIGDELAEVKSNREIATKVFEQTVYGGITNISNVAREQSISISVVQNNFDSLLDCLSDAGLVNADAQALGELIAAEPMEKDHEGQATLGEKTRAWLGERVTAGADAGVKGGVGALVGIAKEAALQYYGLK